jgi:hypothetical protein
MGREAISLPFLISALDGSEWLTSSPDRFTPKEQAPSTHCIKGWVGSEAGLDAVEKRREKKSVAPAGNLTPTPRPSSP